MYQLNVFVPESHLEKVKDAIFNAGGGKQGSYERCCWQTLGEGQFKPSKDSNPFIGEIGKEKKVSEYFLSIYCECDKTMVRAIISELLKAHPYEVPSYHVIEIAQIFP